MTLATVRPNDNERITNAPRVHPTGATAAACWTTHFLRALEFSAVDSLESTSTLDVFVRRTQRSGA